jgi:nitroreductase
MDTIKAILSRHSTRAFLPDPVSREAVLKILEAANHSPSTANTQPWQLFVAGGEVLNRIRRAFIGKFEEGTGIYPDIHLHADWPPALKARIENNRAERFKLLGIDRQDKAALKENHGLNYHFFGAPAAIFICMDRTLGHLSVFDLGMLTQTILLAARHYGLDSIPALNFVGYPDILRQELEIPENLLIVIGVALGYPDTRNTFNQYRSSRRPVQEIAVFKGF